MEVAALLAEPAPRLYETVFEVLRHNVASGRIPAGTIVRESDVARLLGISRVPAREALRRLEAGGDIVARPGRGYLVPGGGDSDGAEKPLPSLAGLALDIDRRHRDSLAQRNWRQRIFEEVELAVAAAAVFGSFRTTETAVAETYGFSRNVAREFLGRLERIGVATQRSNGRWHVEQLHDKEIRDHYAVRRALEPLALADAAGSVDRQTCETLIAGLEQALAKPAAVSRKNIVRFERDLHVDIVLRTANRPMAEAIRRSQLPLISTHISFAASQSAAVVAETLGEHLGIVQALAQGNAKRAARLLAAHLAHAEATALNRLSRIPRRPPAAVPAFLVRDG